MDGQERIEMSRFRRMFKKLDGMLLKGLEKMNLKRKMQVLYLGCVLAPLVFTDAVILFTVVYAESISSRHEMESIANTVQYNISTEVERASSMAKNIYMNRYINEFLTRQYRSPLAYYEAYLDFMEDTLFESSLGTSQMKITMYADNPTLVNGSEFQRLDGARESGWYQELAESGQDEILYCYYEVEPSGVWNSRHFSLIRKLNRYQRDGCEKVLKIDLDYSGLVQNLLHTNTEIPVYVCDKDTVLISNQKNQGIMKPFEQLQNRENISWYQEFRQYGQELDIYVMNKENNLFVYIRKSIWLLILLVCINAFLPWILVRNINRSLTRRLQRLGEVFAGGCEKEELSLVDPVTGNDEIAVLMRNYNWMARRQNELVQTVYKDRLREQEIDLARQNAELLALQSQINPHFLFNALESIRMHSFLKKEYETAHMVEMLAVMERQNVDWGHDDVTVKEEAGFAQAYLELQKYRFGERLSYRLEIEDSCRTYLIPRLSLVTFVENACVHGIEKKSAPGWVFVRVYQEKSELCLEVEDTGGGMPEGQLRQLEKDLQELNIETIKEKGHIGISNACLRLKMTSENTVRFEFDSEEGVGTTMAARIPAEKLRKLEPSRRRREVSADRKQEEEKTKAGETEDENIVG